MWSLPIISFARPVTAALTLCLIAIFTPAQAESMRKIERAGKQILAPKAIDLERAKFVKVDVSHLWRAHYCQNEQTTSLERSCTQNGENAIFTLRKSIGGDVLDGPGNTTSYWLIRINSACRLDAMTTAQFGKNFSVAGWDARTRSNATVQVSISPVLRGDPGPLSSEAAYAYSYSVFATAFCPAGVSPAPGPAHPGPE